MTSVDFIYEFLQIYDFLNCVCDVLAEVMKSLNIPKGVRRVLFRTLNTDRYVISQSIIFLYMILEYKAVYILYLRRYYKSVVVSINF